MTREEVLAAHDPLRRQVDSRLAEVSEERFGGWSAKELLFHFASGLESFSHVSMHLPAPNKPLG